MPTPSVHELRKASDNASVSIVISGVNSFDTTGPTYNGVRTLSLTTTDVTNYGARGGNWLIDVTNISGTPGVTMFVEGKDDNSGKYFTLVSGSKLSTITTELLQVHPSFVSGGVQTPRGVGTKFREVEVLPRTWRLNVAQVSGSGFAGATYTVGFSPIL